MIIGLVQCRVVLILNKAKLFKIWNIYGFTLTLSRNIFEQKNLELAQKSIANTQRYVKTYTLNSTNISKYDLNFFKS